MNYKSLICKLSEFSLSEIQTIWAISQFFFLVIFGAILYYIIRSRKGFLEKYQLYFIALLIFSVLFLCRLLNLIRFECNPDESQWIVQANGLIMHPGIWLKYFLPREFSRIFTIIPLALISLFTIPATYVEARILSLLMWTCFLIFFLAACTRLFNRKISIIVTFLLTILIGLSNQNDAIAYNSELPVITLLMIAFYLFILILTDKNHKRLLPFMVGMVLAMVPFAKEQAIYMAFVFNVYLLVILILDKKWLSIGLLIIGNTVSVSICLLPYAIYGTFDKLIDKAILTISYSKYGLDSSKGAKSLSSLLISFIHLIRVHDFRIIIFLAFASIILGFWLLFTQRQKYNYYHITIFIFVTIMYFTTAYSVYSPHNFFIHYNVLFYFAGSICCAFGLYFISHFFNSDRYFYSLIILLMSAFFLLEKFQGKFPVGEDVISIYNSCGKELLYNSNGLHNVMSVKLKELSHRGDRLMVWGWRNSYYVENGLLPGSTDIYISSLNPVYGDNTIAVKRFEEDMIRFKPKFFIELVGPSQFFSRDTSIYGIYNFPVIDSTLKANYHLISVKGEEKLYLSNN